MNNYIKPYGDTLNDGIVQLAFTLPVENGEIICNFRILQSVIFSQSVGMNNALKHLLLSDIFHHQKKDRRFFPKCRMEELRFPLLLPVG